MRALFVSHAYALPDARAKLRALAGLGYSIGAAVPEQAGSVAASDELGVQLIPVPVDGDRWDANALARAVADFAPGLIQIEEEPWTPVAARAASLAARHKVTLIQYTADTGSTTPSLTGRARRARVLRHVSAILAATEPAAARSRELRPGVPIAIVPQLGVLAPPPAGVHDSTNLALGFVGRLVSSKGLDLLLRALVNLHGDWTLTVVGTGPAQEQLEALGASLGLAGRVRWLGSLSRDRLAAVWPTLNTFVLPARTVPFSADSGVRTLLEAMAHGIPAVVTPANALAETVCEGGLTVPEGDEAALREALQQLHDQPALRAELGGAARRRVLTHYSPDAIARRTAELWSTATTTR